MAVDIHPTVHPDRTDMPERHRTPVARVIAGSLAAGASAALVLTLVVFAGASEHVITGAGWWRSARAGRCWPSSPPASPASRSGGPSFPRSLMTASGLGPLGVGPRRRRPDRPRLALVAGRAGAGGLDVRPGATGTVRSQPLAALPGRRRHRCRGRRRRASRTSAKVRDQHRWAAPGKTYDVDGHRLHLDCRGTGAPDRRAGERALGEMSASWARIAPAVGRHDPGLRLRPRRPGMERRRRAPARRRASRPATCTGCSPSPARPARSCSSDTPPEAPTR